MRLFHDNRNRITIWQWPNFLLSLWIVLKALSMFVDNQAARGSLELLASATLFAWGYVELTTGVNYFRRGLGAIVLLFVIASYFV